MKNRNIMNVTITILFGVASLGLSLKARAVSPPPDGGYPGGNTAEGQNALFGSPIGSYNTAIGFFSLGSLTDASFNTGVGAGTLVLSTASENTAVGTAALFLNTTGASNTGNGAFALFSDTEGSQNTASGDSALYANTEGSFNTATGFNALAHNVGGNSNTANGHAALFNNTSGSDNVAVGRLAGSNLDTGNNNIDIGYNVLGVAGESNTIRIGNNDITDTFIRGISGATASGGAAVFVNGNGKLGTMTSSARFKDEIKEMGNASEAILALNPVKFRYKKEIDSHGTPQFGLVAEEVEKVNPDLVVHDAQGKPQTVRYEQINAMLLNEFLKEHKKVELQARELQDQKSAINELKKELGNVVAQLKGQASQIKKVSARVDPCKGITQTVADKD
jgi:hypothetical protein